MNVRGKLLAIVAAVGLIDLGSTAAAEPPKDAFRSAST